MKQKRVVRSILRLGKRAEIISLVWISMFRYTILSEIGKKNKKGEKLPLSAIGQKILFYYDLLRPLFCPTKKYNSIHVQSYIVSHKKLLIDPKLRRIFIQHLCQSFMLIKQIWSHFFQKSVSQNKIKNNRGDIILWYRHRCLFSVMLMKGIDVMSVCNSVWYFDFFSCRSPIKIM